MAITSIHFNLFKKFNNSSNWRWLRDINFFEQLFTFKYLTSFWICQYSDGRSALDSCRLSWFSSSSSLSEELSEKSSSISPFVWERTDTLPAFPASLKKQISNKIHPLGPKSDQHQFSPNNISRSSRVKVMRITSLITKRRTLWSSTKFSQLFLKEMYGDQSGEFVCGSWGLKG